MLKNIKLKIICYLIGFMIRRMPREWQTEKAIKNLISTGAIETRAGRTE